MKRFADLRISTKLVIGFLVIAIIAMIIGSVGLISLLGLSKEDKQLYEENTLGLQNAGSASAAFVLIRYNTYKLSVLEDKAAIKDVVDSSTKLLEDLDGYMAGCSAALTTEEFKTLFGTISDQWNNQYKPDMEKVMKAAQSGDVAGAKALIPGLATLGTNMYTEYVSFFSKLSDDARVMANDNALLAQNGCIVIATATVLGVIAAVVLALFIARIISKPLSKAVDAADRLAVGDLDADLTTEAVRRDEIGRLSNSFKQLVASTRKQVQTAKLISEGDLTVQVELRSDKDQLGQGLSDLVSGLKDLVASIYAAADQVADGSGMLSNSSAALSQGATEQAGAVQELTATIQQIATQTAVNAQNAEEANELAGSAKVSAEQGNIQMKSMLAAMDDINDSSRSIGRIVKVIDDIAFQTNILALNAAVEAARAGAQGKGFAVVAEEVRTLANKSASAVKETTDLIDTSMRRVEAGTKIAVETAESLSRIVRQIERAAELNQAIADASKEQSEGIEQVNQGITQVSQVVQTNAATSEESAAASEELSSQAEHLKEIVSVFKIGENREAVKRKPVIDIGKAQSVHSGTPAYKLPADRQDFGKY